MEADFRGYATKAGLKCTDGRTIMPGAFKHQDQSRVPLVWQHGHTDPENVLGHAILENRDDGVYAYGYFNSSDKATHTKGLVSHGDITMLSIWANELIERSSRVLHGSIREVSLVLSGANPGALIENVTVSHSDGGEDLLDDEAIIYTGLDFQHADTMSDTTATNDTSNTTASSDETVQDIYDSMTEKQKQVLHFMVGQALDSKNTSSTDNSSANSSSDNVSQDNLDHDNLDSDDTNQEGNNMTRNVFEKDGTEAASTQVLSHSDVKEIVADATKTGSLKAAVENYALSHGITNIDVLFPDAQSITGAPEWDSRRTEWVAGVLSGARKSPFSRIKTWTADITYEDARAKGYIKGNMKKEEFFSVAKRVTTPQTIYKKQKLDRDDMIDITDFDVVAWMKGEMRLMLDEELARAVLVGDGRDVADDDKIQEGNVRPIAKDDPYYTITVNVNLADANSTVQEVIDAVTMNRQYYKGTGTPTFYTTETFIGQLLLLKDTLGRRIYSSLDQLASELRVSTIVPVEILDSYPETLGIIVNMADYVIGSDKGGAVSMFDDFDIDYNQYKYLIETRISGALTKPKSAMILTTVASGDVMIPDAGTPAYDAASNAFQVPTIPGIGYYDANGQKWPGTQQAIPEGESVVVQAIPDSGHYFGPGVTTRWTYQYIPV